MLSDLLVGATYIVSLVIFLSIAAIGFCFAGFIAGIWTNWKGAIHGAAAAGVAFVSYYIILAIRFFDYWRILAPRGIIGAALSESLPYIIIIGLCAIGIGALGGFFGERMRR